MRANAHETFHENEAASTKPTGTAFGSLSEFAKPERIPEEEGAFERAMAEKHASEAASRELDSPR